MLRSARNDAGLTQAQIVRGNRDEELWSRSHLSRVERGESGPSSELVAQYELRCGISDKRLSRFFASLGLDHVAATHQPLPDLLRHLSASELRMDPRSVVAVQDAGLSWVGLDFYHGVPWGDLFASSQQLDMFVTYARSWRRSLTSELRHFAGRPDTIIRVLLPSIESPRDTALPEIAKRAGVTVPDLISYISDAIAEANTLGAQVWATDSAPLYSLYRFDDKMVVSMYNHQRGQSEGVPTVLLSAGGSLFGWFRADYDSMLANDSLAWRLL